MDNTTRNIPSHEACEVCHVEAGLDYGHDVEDTDGTVRRVCEACAEKYVCTFDDVEDYAYNFYTNADIDQPEGYTADQLVEDQVAAREIMILEQSNGVGFHLFCP